MMPLDRRIVVPDRLRAGPNKKGRPTAALSLCVDGRVAYPEEDVLPLGFDGATN